jgi:DNA-binding NarL/FixJ family response regulator
MSSTAEIVLLCRDPHRAVHWREQLDNQGRHHVSAIRRTCAEGAAVVDKIDPDVVVCETELLDGPAPGLIRHVKRGAAHAGTRILIIAASADDPVLQESLRCGADSYFVDNGPGPSLSSRVEEMLKGESKMSPEIARQVLDHFMRQGPARLGQRTVHDLLDPLIISDLERGVLLRLTQGQSVPDIASAERLSIHQVAKCIRGLYRKMAWDLRAGDLKLELV